jgi:hypothetical protein
MAVFRGDQFMLEVNTSTTATPTWVVVADMNSFSKSSQRNNQTFPVFQRSLPHSITGPREQTYSVSGYFNPADPGQQKLFSSEQSNSIVQIRVTHNGTDGFTQNVRVGTYTYDADPEGLQEVSFEFAADDASVVVGDGLAL